MNAQDLPDERLIAGCLDGDDRCWEALYRRYYPVVHRVAAWPRWGFTRAEVDDCVQEVFLELVRSLGGFRGESRLSTFLVRLAKNRCVSQIRRKTAQKRVREEVGYRVEERKGAIDEPVALAISGDPSPADAMVAREEAEELLRCLQQLNPECQSILRLRFYDELSYDEICRSLALPLGTVCSRLKRCLERLRKVMSP